jgi:hypothetical protein
MDYEKKNKHSTSDVVGSVLVMLVLLIPMMLLEGFILSQLWVWFIVPVFSLPVLSVGQSVGIMVVVGMITTQITYNVKAEGSLTSQVFERALNSVFMRLWIWGVGYVVYCFIS